MDDLTNNCTSKCFMEYGQQKEYFLIRKYTNRCKQIRSNEQWAFKTDIKDQVNDLMNTTKAYEQWENKQIRECAQTYLSNYTTKTNVLLKEKTTELEEFRQEHPVISTGVDLGNKAKQTTGSIIQTMTKRFSNQK